MSAAKIAKYSFAAYYIEAYDKKHYMTSLMKVSVAAHQPALSNRSRPLSSARMCRATANDVVWDCRSTTSRCVKTCDDKKSKCQHRHLPISIQVRSCSLDRFLTQPSISRQRGGHFSWCLNIPALSGLASLAKVQSNNIYSTVCSFLRKLLARKDPPKCRNNTAWQKQVYAV